MMTVKDCAYGNPVGFIKKGILKQDIKRGVKFLNEQAYSKHWGCTTASALFFMELAKHIDLKQVYRVDFKETVKHHYTVLMYTKDGFTIQFKGLAFGYFGEGSRGAEALLKAIGGFNDEQLNRIFTDKKDFRLMRKVS
jgi:hypothetical protein